MASLVLASGSRARQGMLQAAGVTFTVQTANVDEAAIRARLAVLTPAAHVATVLATEKALAVSKLSPGDLVIGSDQVLALGLDILSKPGDRAAARAQLASLRGRTHALHSAVALARDGVLVWSGVETAELAMRDFSDAFLDSYLDAVGEEVCHSVGAYHLEGRGIQLFDRVRGDYFTILGMPLLPLLAELRRLGMIAA